MRFKKMLIILPLIMIFFTGCSSSDSSSGPEDVEKILYINEIMSANQYGPIDDDGNHGDWIEIYNGGDDDVDLAGMYLTNNRNDPTMWHITDSKSGGTTVDAGDYLVIWCDANINAGNLHASFMLVDQSGELAIIDDDGVTEIDAITYDQQVADISWGRVPDGSDNWGSFGAGFTSMPTPGTENGSGDLPIAEFIINEFMADNEFTSTDDNGDADDWIEIYNMGNIPGDLGGYFIADDLEELNSWQIPETDPLLTTINPGEYLILWADREPEQGVLHVDIVLSASGEAIALTAPDGVTLIDSYEFDDQETDISLGRMPDGSDNWAYFGEGYDTMATPGTENGSGEVPEAILMINEFLAGNDSTYADENGEYDDWIEIYNAGNIAADISGMYMTDDLGNLTMWQVPFNDPSATTIPPGGFILIWADTEIAQGVLHADFKLDVDGEEIGLIDSDGVTVIDSYTFDEQQDDVSEGRSPDGSDNWEFFTSPTPGASNQ